jgi:hypothetical protein
MGWSRDRGSLYWAHKGNIAINVMTASKSILRMIMFGLEFPSNRRECGWREYTLLFSCLL